MYGDVVVTRIHVDMDASRRRTPIPSDDAGTRILVVVIATWSKVYLTQITRARCVTQLDNIVPNLSFASSNLLPTFSMSIRAS